MAKNIEKQNRITRRDPIRVCEVCGRKFRLNGGDGSPHCSKCIKEMQEENEKVDKR